MHESNEGSPWWMLVVGVIVVLLFVGTCPHDSADTELARTAHEAVKLARETKADDRSAILWSGRFRLLSLVIGICVPIVVVLLIFRHTNKSEIDAAEIIECAERYALPSPTTRSTPNLPPTSAQPVAGTDPNDDSSPGTPAD